MLHLMSGEWNDLHHMTGAELSDLVHPSDLVTLMAEISVARAQALQTDGVRTAQARFAMLSSPAGGEFTVLCDIDIHCTRCHLCLHVCICLWDRTIHQWSSFDRIEKFG
jgi:hypothetical protein